MTPTTDTDGLTLQEALARIEYEADGWESGSREHERVWEVWRFLSALAAKVAEVERERDALRTLCFCAYQMAGVHDAPEAWLDALSDAAMGEPFDTEGLLPYMPDAVCAAEAEVAKLRDWKARHKSAVSAAYKILEAARPLILNLERVSDFTKEEQNG